MNGIFTFHGWDISQYLSLVLLFSVVFLAALVVKRVVQFAARMIAGLAALAQLACIGYTLVASWESTWPEQLDKHPARGVSIITSNPRYGIYVALAGTVAMLVAVALRSEPIYERLADRAATNAARHT